MSATRCAERAALLIIVMRAPRYVYETRRASCGSMFDADAADAAFAAMPVMAMMRRDYLARHAATRVLIAARRLMEPPLAFHTRAIRRYDAMMMMLIYADSAAALQRHYDNDIIERAY